MINKGYISKLLANLPFNIDGINIRAKTLREIFSLEDAEDTHYRYLNILILDPKNAYENFDDKFTTYDLLKAFMINSTESEKEFIMESLKYFIDEEIKFAYIPEKDVAIFYLRDKLITSEMYEKIKEVLMYQNCIEVKKIEPKKESKESEKVRKLKEKIEGLKSKVKEIKKNKDSDLTINDYISSFVSYSKNYNMLNVWDLTLYQFYDQLKRLQLVSEYDINMQALLHGASSKDIKIKHFISKLED